MSKPKSLAYIATYKAQNSVNNNPAEDFHIGRVNGVVGCGTRIKTRGFHWFTILEDVLVYNGPLGEQIQENPWAVAAAAEGEKVKDWYVYKVQYHHILGDIDTVLAAAGLTRMILPNSQNRWVTDKDIQQLIDYAHRTIASRI